MKEDKYLKPINIGIDLGPTSVGIAMIDEDGKPVEKPIVRIFSDACNGQTGEPTNKIRRIHRHQRRNINRKMVRRKACVRLLAKYYKLDESKINEILQTNSENILDLKLDVIVHNKKITTEQQIRCLFHYFKHRGNFYKVTTDKVLPSIKLKQHYDKNGFWRGSEYAAQFSHKEWVSEIEKFMNILEIDDKFCEQYLELWAKHRDYQTGPGGEIQPTKYGMHFYDSHGKIQKREGNNLWDALIGKCTFFPEENRCLKKTTSFELFSLIERINNLTYINDEIGEYKKINKQIKISYLEELLTTGKNSLNRLKKKIAEFNKVKPESIQFITREGELLEIRKAKDNENKSATKDPLKDLKLINSIFCQGLLNKKIFNNNELDWKSIQQFDDIANWISTNISENNLIKADDAKKQIADISLNKEIIDELRNVYCLNDKQITSLKEHLIKNFNLYHGVSRVSTKFIKDVLQKLIDVDGSNTSSIWKDIKPKDKNQIEKFDDVFQQQIKNIGSPSVKKSVEQFFKLFTFLYKNVIKNKYRINSINIELCRERNSKEVRESIKKGQDFYEEYLSKYTDKINELKAKAINPGELKRKLFLYDCQGYIDPYDGKPLDIHKVMMDPTYTEIDHIYNLSWSGDDSLANKVLTKKSNNNLKGAKTPAEFLGSKQDALIPIWKDKFAQDLPGYDERIAKLSNKETDKNKFIGFIGRNLSDTRYITTVVYDLIKLFVQTSTVNKETIKINSVNPKFTRFIDKFLRFPESRVGEHYKKNRDEYKHHAIDAINCAYACFIPQKIQTHISSRNMYDGIEDDLYFSEKDIAWIDDIKQKIGKSKLFEYIQDDKNFMFSSPVQKHRGWKLHDETLYSAKFYEGKVLEFSYEKILEMKNDKLKGYFEGDDAKSLAIYYVREQNSKENLYDFLKKIYCEYKSDKENAFVKFMRDAKNVENPRYLDISINDGFACNIKISRLKCVTEIKNYYRNPRQNNSIYKNLEWKKLMFYKGKTLKGESTWVCIPLSCKYFTCVTSINSKTKENKSLIKLNHDIILNELKNRGIIINNDKSRTIKNQNLYKFSLFYGDIVSDDNINFYKIIGFVDGRSTVELVPSNKRFPKDIRKRITINKLIKDYKIYNKNIIGKIFLDKKRVFD